MNGVVLIGSRGAGKTTVGAILAGRMRLPFRDSDVVVGEETGKTIAELLSDGLLRVREAQVVARLLEGEPAVVAAGGGVVLWEGFSAAAENWHVVWLDAAADVLAARIAGSDRPSLTGADIAIEIGQVARERARLYEAAAGHRVDTSRDDSETVAFRIYELLKDEAQAPFDSAD